MQNKSICSCCNKYFYLRISRTSYRRCGYNLYNLCKAHYQFKLLDTATHGLPEFPVVLLILTVPPNLAPPSVPLLYRSQNFPNYYQSTQNTHYSQMDIQMQLQTWYLFPLLKRTVLPKLAPPSVPILINRILLLSSHTTYTFCPETATAGRLEYPVVLLISTAPPTFSPTISTSAV